MSNLMKHSLLSHGLWAALVLLAFFVGTQLRSGSPVARDGATSSNTRLTALAYTTGAADGTWAPSQSPSKETASTLDLEIGSADFEFLAREAVKNPNPIARRLAFSELLRSMTPENAMAIREQLVALGAEGETWRDFNYSWGTMAGRDAVLFAASSEEPDLDATLSGWASASPEAALAFLDDLPEEMRGDRAKLTSSIIAGIADADTARAAQIVLSLAEQGNSESAKLIALVAGKTIRAAGLQEASLWSESLSDENLRSVAIDRVARAYAREAPQEAAAWVQRFADQDFAARGIEEVADSWAERDPNAAVGWLESLPTGAGQKTGLTSVFGDWEDRDPLAASEYLASMPESEQRDSAISGFSRGYAWQDPQTAIAWAEVIDDPELRTSTLTRAGQAYFRRDPEGASLWLQTSGLPPEAQKEVLQPRRRG